MPTPDATTRPAPVPASTVVLVRDRAGDAGFEVFMVRRHDQSAFLGGAHVFPGGRVDAADRADLEGWCDGVAEAGRGLPDLDVLEAGAYRAAAVRELFEEAGVLLARNQAGRVVGPAPADATLFSAERLAVASGAQPLRAVLAAFELRAALDLLVPLSRWVTPAGETRSFDTRFFVARLPDQQAPLHDRRETTESVWLTPAEALQAAEGGEIALAPPTWVTLGDLARQRSILEVEAFARRQPMVARQPHPIRQHDRKMLVLPGDPLYPAPHPAPVVGPTRFVLDGRRWRPVRTGEST